MLQRVPARPGDYDQPPKGLDLRPSFAIGPRPPRHLPLHLPRVPLTHLSHRL